MKPLYLIITLLFSALSFAQQPQLLDSLNPLQKKLLNESYNKRKKTFFAQLPYTVPKKELAEVKKIFNESYKEIQEKIDQNELLSDSALNTYLNKLTASIQKENPEIPQNLSILVSREYKTNAYNRGEGTVVINNHLLNALDSEDQLVYILCHEMAHQTLDHVLETVKKHVQFNNSSELKSKTKQIKNQKYHKKTSAHNLLKEIAYENSAESRKREIQADSLGYVFYSRLNRNPQQVAKTLEKLRDSDKEPDSLTPKDYIKILKSFNVQADEKWFEMKSFEKLNYEVKNKFNTDSLRTHPNIDVRIEKVISIAPEIKGYEKATDLKTNPSEEFTLWQQSAAYQIILNEYNTKRYGNSLYEALKLYNRKPDELLKEWIGLNFKKLYEAKQTYKLNRYVSQVNAIKYTNSYNLFSTFIFNLNLVDFEAITKYF